MWNHSVFSKNRDRLIEHDTVTELFNATVEVVDKRGMLSGAHFSVDGTMIQTVASHKSMWCEDGSDDDRPPKDRRGQPRSNDTHESTIAPESRLCRKSDAAPVLPSYPGHVLTGNRRGLVVNPRARTAHCKAERDLANLGKRVTVGADKAYDTKGIVKACREMQVTAQVAQNLNRNGDRAIDGRTTRHACYEISQCRRKCIEQCFG